MQSQETELQRQLQNLHQEDARISDHLNQKHISNISMKTRKQGLAQQCRRQPSNSVADRLKFLVCEHRWSGINIPKTSRRKSLKYEERKLKSLGRQQSAEIQRFITSLHAAEMETKRNQPLWEDAPTTLKRWSYAAEECAQLVTTHTAGDTTQSTLRNCPL